MQANRQLGRVLLALTLAAAGCGGQSEGEWLASARGYLDKNDPKAAVIQLKNVLSQQPSSAEARYLLGRALLESGDTAGAEIELQRALDLGHAPGPVAPLLARAWLATGQHDKLIKQFADAAPAEAAAAVEVHLAVAEAHSASGAPDKARAAIGQALERSPQSLPALIALARLKAGTGSPDGALAALDELLASHPDSVDAWQLKAAVQAHAKGDIDGAIASYRQALALRAERAELQAALISLYLAKRDAPAADRQFEAMKAAVPGHPLTHFYEAQLLFARGDYAQARQRLQEVMRLVPDNVGVLHVAGATELQLGALAQAEGHLVKALQLSPRFVAARRLLAETYLRSNQPSRALAVLRPVLEHTPIDAETLTAAGQAALLAGDDKTADALFKRAAAAKPDDTRARTALAMAQLSRGRSDAAFSELQSIAAADPGTAADMALISARLQQREFDAALEAIAGLEKKQPASAAAAELRGRVHLARRDMAAARKHFDEALRRDPRYLSAVVSLATLDVAERQPEAAKARFDKLLQVEPKNVQALLALAELKRRTGGSRDEAAALIAAAVNADAADPQPRLVLIEHHLAAGNTQAALSAAHEAVAAIPLDPVLQEKLARTLLYSGDINQASSRFGKIAAQHPDAVLGHQGLAETALAKRDFAAAWKSARRALELAPASMAAQRVALLAAMGLKRPQDALQVARDMQKQRPSEALGFILQGEIEAEQKQWNAAAGSFRKALATPHPAQAPARLHAMLMQDSKPADAARFAEEWSRGHPKDGIFLRYLADAAAAQGDLPTAAARYRQLLQVQPDDAVALNNLAGVLIRQNKPGAVALAERALAAAPGRAALMDTLALALASEGQHAKAIALQKDVVAKAPGVPVYRLTLAKIYLLSGDKALARSELDALLEPGTVFPQRAEAADLLKLVSG